MTALKGVQPAELDEYWTIAAPLLKRALKHGSGYRWTLESILGEIRCHKAHLWVTVPGNALVIVTTIEEYPKAKVLRMFAVAGKLPPDWHDVCELLERWGASVGCTEVEAQARIGWARGKHPPGYRIAPWLNLIKDI